ncbi:hypothetical protein FQN50_007177 [Emmonsiellopsis sp. PD_5]|nr:hypothetical protein FQN50_007177 [Emmonsiellopsis sp. PD_5]
MATLTFEKPDCVPEDFLASPPQNASFHRIDFTKTTDPLPEYKAHYAAVVDDLFTEEECNLLIHAAEQSTLSEQNKTPNWEVALVNVGGGMQKLIPEARSCSRIIWDTPWLADRILSRILPFIKDPVELLRDVPHVTGPGPAKRGETWRLSRLNERLRFLRYHGGEYFHQHKDGCYVTPSGEEISFFTVHLYLNGEPSEQKSSKLSPDVYQGTVERDELNSRPLRGGATTFYPPWNSDNNGSFPLYPKTGSVLIFQHKDLLHSGEEVLQGTKYTLRTDIMFRQDDSPQ